MKFKQWKKEQDAQKIEESKRDKLPSQWKFRKGSQAEALYISPPAS